MSLARSCVWKSVLFHRKLGANSYSQLGRVLAINRYENKNTLCCLKYSTAVDNKKSIKNPVEVELVYSGTVTSLVKRIKVLSFTTSALGIVAQPYIFTKSLEVGGAPLTATLIGIMGFFTYLTPFLLQMVIKKYITKIEYNPETKMYDAYTMTFFMGSKKLTFSPEDLQEPDVPGMFTTFTIKNEPVLVEVEKLKKSDHYVKLMGYDKPFDLKLSKIADVVQEAENENKK